MKKSNIQLKNLFLQQSYLDAWEDYERSLKRKNFIRWDYVVLTASNEEQATAYRYEINERLKGGYLSSQTSYFVISDPDGKRVGSGGATLNVLTQIREREPGFEGLRILTIHSGGDSKRVPQYSACGKLFSPVPRELPDGRASTLFDEFMIGMSGVPSRISEGMLVLSGDVLLLFNPLQIDGQIVDAAAISMKESVEIGQNHGVFLNDGKNYVSKFLHKQTVDALKREGAVNEHGNVDLDTGAILLGTRLLNVLYNLICEDGVYSEACFEKFVNENVRISFYGDFLYPLANSALLDEYLRQAAEGEITEELLSCRKKIWECLSPFSLQLISLSPAHFIHFGTTRELHGLLTDQIAGYGNLGWKRQVASVGEKSDDEMSYAAYNSYVGGSAHVGENAYIENSFVLGTTTIGGCSIVSGLRLEDCSVPSETVCHGLRLRDDRFVIRVYGLTDNPKETLEEHGSYMNVCLRDFLEKNNLFLSDVWNADEGHDLWRARLFPVCTSEEQAWEWTKLLFDMVRGTARKTDIQEWCLLDRMSLNESYQLAEYTRESNWKKELADRILSRKFENAILRGDSEADALKALGSRGVTPGIYTELMNDADMTPFSLKMRIYHSLANCLKSHDLVETGNKQDRRLSGEELENKCFQVIRAYCAEETEFAPKEHFNRICESEVNVQLPVRVNWGGGWTDTPPYCNENGGVVLNAAVKLNGIFPVQVSVRRLDTFHVQFESADVGAYGICDRLEDIQKCHDPYDPFALHKAALISCGIIPEISEKNSTLESILQELGGGIYLSTQVVGVPKGSGLGTSSILSAACVKAIRQFVGMSTEDDVVSEIVLNMEQLMSTGGGWQDQVGGLIGGVKLISSKPGSRQKLQIDSVRLCEETKAELQKRFALIYTGQRRLARNLLRDVVGGYIEGRPDSVEALREMKPLAGLMRFQLEQGNIDAFAELLNQHWERSLQLDKGTTNTCIDQIFLAIDDLIDGKFICGAGGGGFLQVIMKKGVTHEMLRERLLGVFQDAGVDVWRSEFVW